LYASKNGEKIRYHAGSTNTALPSGTDVWQRVQLSLRQSSPSSPRRYWHPTLQLSRRTKNYRQLFAPNPKTSRPSFLPRRAFLKGELDSHPSASLHEERWRRNIRDVKSERYVYTCWYATKRDAKDHKAGKRVVQHMDGGRRRGGGSRTDGFVSRSIHLLQRDLRIVHSSRDSFSRRRP
jgi:hypothetical protein